jgi:hypothetical protein
MRAVVEFVQIRADQRTRLRVYLNDHLAGASGGIRLAQRCRANNEGTELATFLDSLLGELRDDAQALQDLMRQLGMPKAVPKHAVVAAAEWVGRLKLNGQLLGYSALSRLVELEALCGGVDAKRNLWLSLLASGAAGSAMDEGRLNDLAARATRQRDALEAQRRAAARMALSV